jgi:hypothetical protein
MCILKIRYALGFGDVMPALALRAGGHPIMERPGVPSSADAPCNESGRVND